MAEERWYDLGAVEELQKHPLRRALAKRAVEMAQLLLAADCDKGTIERAGRKAGAPEMVEEG